MYEQSDLVIVIPMWKRAHRFMSVLDSARVATPGARVLFVVSTDDDDLRAWINDRPDFSIDHVLYTDSPSGTRGDYARKINAAYRQTTEALLFTGADDLDFHPGWFERAVPMLTAGIGVVGTNDRCNLRVRRGQHSTHSLVTRAYVDEHGTIDEPGKVLHEGYIHEFVDDEFIRTAQWRKAFAPATHAIVEHLHPDVGKAPMDDSYRAQGTRMEDGRALFQSRAPLWGGGGLPKQTRRRMSSQPRTYPRRIAPRPGTRKTLRSVDPTDVTLSVSIIVASYGAPEYATMGVETAAASEDLGAVEILQRHDRDGTLAQVRNDLARDAAGDWLCFLDVDDRLEPGYLNAMSEAAAEHGLRRPTLLAPAIRYVTPAGAEISPPRVPNIVPRRKPLAEMNRCVIGTLVPRVTYLAVGGFAEWPLWEDWALWLACARVGLGIYEVPAAVYRATRREGSRNTAIGVDRQALWREIRDHHEREGGSLVDP
jgi:glycosyltransferase involved in cell wall biosynthesis